MGDCRSPAYKSWVILPAFLGVVGANVWHGLKEVTATLPDGGKVGLSTRGPSAFRVRFAGASGPIDTPMVGPDEEDAIYQTLDKQGTGIVASFGSVKITGDGRLILYNSAGLPITQSGILTSTLKSLSLDTQYTGLYGRGASPDDTDTLISSESEAQVCNRATYTPYYYSPDGYAALGVVGGGSGQKFPVSYKSDGSNIDWFFKGAGPFELYLMPAISLEDGTKAYYSLIGAPRIPPQYAFGFMASRWGWESRDYIENVMDTFRGKKFPIDAVICDFEWFTNESDYNFQPQGRDYYQDFSFNKKTFPDPRNQLQSYAKKGFRVGGIRKPRLGNTLLLQEAKSKGWILPTGEPAGSWPPAGSYAEGRCLDFSQPDTRNWYSDKMAHFSEDGMDFWWNDEGEANYFTFHWWNVAEVQALRSRDKLKRFYSLNRAWSPGMARLGATVWTGDIDPTWKDLAGTPGMMLNWVLGGAPYVACDIGGFTRETTSELLVRWMQLGVFMPTMRVHSVNSAKPHWPWLWGEDAAQAMRDSLELRYRLVPYHYSLAHSMYRYRKLWIRPLVFDFPADPVASKSVSQWMDGDILVAPVLSQDSQKKIYLPAGLWYPLSVPTSRGSASEPISGPTHITQHADFREIPAYVRAGTVLPLASVIQSTQDLPGGALEVQVYGGADGIFEMVEDDGETTTYEAGHSRTLNFQWDDASRRLSWSLTGYVMAPGKKAFKRIFATLIESGRKHITEVFDIGVVGSVEFPENLVHS